MQRQPLADSPFKPLAKASLSTSVYDCIFCISLQLVFVCFSVIDRCEFLMVLIVSGFWTCWVTVSQTALQKCFSFSVSCFVGDLFSWINHKPLLTPAKMVKKLLWRDTSGQRCGCLLKFSLWMGAGKTATWSSVRALAHCKISVHAFAEAAEDSGLTAVSC